MDAGAMDNVYLTFLKLRCVQNSIRCPLLYQKVASASVFFS